MFKELNPLLHSELRLAGMAILIGVESSDFVFIRQQTGATAGNLSVQLDKLAKADYIEIEKTFRGKMPCTVCRITDTGRDAFAEYVAALQPYIKRLPQNVHGVPPCLLPSIPARCGGDFLPCQRQKRSGKASVSEFTSCRRTSPGTGR